MNIREKKHQSQLHGGLGIRVLDGDINLALRLFKQEIKTSGIIKEYRDKQEYVKPSIRRRNIKDKAIYKEKLNIININ